MCVCVCVCVCFYPLLQSQRTQTVKFEDLKRELIDTPVLQTYLQIDQQQQQQQQQQETEEKASTGNVQPQALETPVQQQENQRDIKKE